MAAVKLFVVSYANGKSRVFYRQGMSGDSARTLAKALSMQGLKAAVHRFDVPSTELWKVINKDGSVISIAVKPR
jgi:hypothetical protein